MEKKKIIIDYQKPDDGNEMNIAAYFENDKFFISFKLWKENLYIPDPKNSKTVIYKDFYTQEEFEKEMAMSDDYLTDFSLTMIDKLFRYINNNEEFDLYGYELVDRRKEKINLEIEVLKNKLEKIKDKTIWSYSDSYNHKLITEFRHIEKRIKELEGEINGKE